MEQCPPPYTDWVGVRVRQETHCTLPCTRWALAIFGFIICSTYNERVGCLPVCARTLWRLWGEHSLGCDNKAFRVVVHALVCDGK